MNREDVRAASRFNFSLVRFRFAALAALEGLLVAPGIGIDVEEMAMLGEAVDECAEAGGIVEHRAPLLEREIGSDYDGFGFMPTADDMKEQICSTAVAGDVSEFVQNEQIG